MIILELKAEISSFRNKCLALLTFLVFCNLHGIAEKIRHDSLTFSVFGKVHLFELGDGTKPMILYFTGDKGWNESEKQLVKNLSIIGTTMAVIDTRQLESDLARKKNTCVYPAANVEELSKVIQKKLKRTSYQYPVLMGHASGSSWVFALLCQAPQNTFAGGIFLGYCNSLNTSKPLCKGNGLMTRKTEEDYIFLPSCQVLEPIHIFFPAGEKNCNANSLAELAVYKNVITQVLQNTDINFSNPAKILPMISSAYESIIAAGDPFTAFLQKPGKETGILQELPLTFHPALKNDTLPLCIMISGDGGWTGFDQNLAVELSKAGIPVCGLNSLKYFWNKKTPEKVAEDLTAIARHYMIQTGRKSLMFVGYSFGADVLPFVYNKLPPEIMNITHLVTLMSPSTLADFEIHYSDMLGVENSSDKFDVFHEIRTIFKTKILCIYGSDEEDEAFHPYLQKNVSVIILSGGHHYGNNFDKICFEILNNLKR